MACLSTHELLKLAAQVANVANQKSDQATHVANEANKKLDEAKQEVVMTQTSVDTLIARLEAHEQRLQDLEKYKPVQKDRLLQTSGKCELYELKECRQMVRSLVFEFVCCFVDKEVLD
jgi:hypothetical protein